MSFFESIPQPPPPEPVRRRVPAWMRSDAVILGSVPGEVVLIRTEQVAVAIGSVRAYPNGLLAGQPGLPLIRHPRDQG